MSWDKTEGGDFGHSLRPENFIRGLNIELANERNLRAKAEAEVERLKLMVKSITSGLDEAIETVHFLEAGVERLRNLHDKSLVRMSIAETQNINLLAELAKYKRAFDLACSNLSAQIDGLYCPADAIDFDLDINYCDNCDAKDYSVCWADFYLQQAEREAVKNKEGE